MPLKTNKKRQLNMHILRSKSLEDVTAYIKLGLDEDEDKAGVVYQIPSSFMVYYFELETAIKEAHTIKTEGKGKNIHIPYAITT